MITLSPNHYLELYGPGADAVQAILDETDGKPLGPDAEKFALSIVEINGMEVVLTTRMWVERFGHSLSGYLKDHGLRLSAPNTMPIPRSHFDIKYNQKKGRR